MKFLVLALNARNIMSPFHTEETLALVVSCKIMLVMNSFKVCSNMQNYVCHDSKLHDKVCSG